MSLGHCVLPWPAIFTKHHKSRKTAIIGAVAGAVAMGVLSVPSNYFVVYPAYVQFYHMPLEAILGMYQAILPSADSLIKCLILFNLPFTLVKGPAGRCALYADL